MSKPAETVPEIESMSPTGEAYLKWYHENELWKNTFYRGVRTLKFPNDMWNYQEIIIKRQVEWVVETGSRHGGSAMFFSDLLRNAGRKGKVISMDLVPQLDPIATADPNIIFLQGSSGTPEAAQRIGALLPPDRGSLFMILDADHNATHVRRELEVLVPLLRTGDYLLVEDTVVNGHPVRPDHGPGPLEAVRHYIKNNPDSLIRDIKRERRFGCTFAVEGFYIKS